MRTRTPTVAGAFYPREVDKLTDTIRSCFLDTRGPGMLPPRQEVKGNFPGIVCPHAGYMFSGPVAANSFYEISHQKPDLVIIVGPNHWGIGCNVSSMTECEWETPLGKVQVDDKYAKKLKEKTQIVELDFVSHAKEHSLEVQLPMLQSIFNHQFTILPIIMIDQSKNTAIQLGKAVANIAAENPRCLIIGSSDFTHYEPNSFAYEQDKSLIDPMLELNIDEFYSVLTKKQVTACGYGAMAATMQACKDIGCSSGTLLKYATSGDVTGEKDSVVGYASITFS